MAAVTNSGVLTLTQIMERFGPDQKLEGKIVELLSQENGPVTDAGWIMGNLPLGTQTKIRTGLPQVAATSYNEHVQTSAGGVMTIQEASMKVEARSLLDEDEAELGGKGNADMNRAMEAYGFAESLNQFFAYNIFYGDPKTNSKLIKGIHARYNSLEGGNAQNIIDAGGTGSTNASIDIVCWKPMGCTMFYPLGAVAGIFHDYEGVLALPSNNATLYPDSGPALQRFYSDFWRWKYGLTIPDWRCVVRICNIDIPTLLAKTGASLIDLLMMARERIPNIESGRTTIYMNRTVKQMLNIQRRDAVQIGGQLEYAVVDGVQVPAWEGIPIRVVDQLLNSESRVV